MEKAAKGFFSERECIDFLTPHYLFGASAIELKRVFGIL
jgi:hypothetical protein